MTAARRRFAVMPPKGGVPVPGVDFVWSSNGVDHDPIPAHRVTVCGLEILPPFVYEPAGATPCPDCFEGVPR